MVSVEMITYGHENYIRQAIESILMQETNFDYDLVIADDCSPDNTQEIVNDIIKNHPKGQIIKYFRHKKNIGMNANGLFALKQCKAKYIALCEGDDYWTDPYKLQKQIDFLEKNPKYVVSFTNFDSIKNDKDLITNNPITDKLPEIFTIDYNNLYDPYCTMTLTCVFLSEALDAEKDFSNLKHVKDNTTYALLLRKGLGVFMNFKSSVYRLHDGGVFSMKSNFYKTHNSYLNLNEIIDFIPQSRTKNIIQLKDWWFLNSAIEVLKLKKNKIELEKYQKDIIVNLLKKSRFKDKLRLIKASILIFVFNSKIYN